MTTWKDLPCGYSYKWDGEAGRLSDGAGVNYEGEARSVDKRQVLAEIKADCGLDLDYDDERGWDGAYGEPDATVKLERPL